MDCLAKLTFNFIFYETEEITKKMSLIFPPLEQRNTTLFDYILTHCPFSSVQRFMSIAQQQPEFENIFLKNNTRLHTLLVKYIQSMPIRTNVHVGGIRNEEMYATLQFCNARQTMHELQFDCLIHCSIPTSYKSDFCCQVFHLEPINKFLLEAVRLDLSIWRTGRKMHADLTQRPILLWSSLARSSSNEESVCVSSLCGGKAAFSLSPPANHDCSRCRISRDAQFETAYTTCHEFQGNYLLGIVLHCRRKL